MQEEFDKALFELAYSNLVDDFFDKNMQINKIELELIRKTEGVTSKLEAHLPIIKHCRKTIDSMDLVIKDMREGFVELKIEPVYEVLSSIYRVFVHIMKTLSETYLCKHNEMKLGQTSLLIHTQKLMELKSTKREKTQNSKSELCYSCIQERKKQAKKMQYLDFTIFEIEKKEKLLESQMSTLIADLTEEKSRISKLQSNNKVQIFKQLYKTFTEISKKAESLFQNFSKTSGVSFNLLKDLTPAAMEERLHQQLEKDIGKMVKKRIGNIISELYQIYLKTNGSKIQQKMKQACQQRILNASSKPDVGIKSEKSAKKLGRSKKSAKGQSQNKNIRFNRRLSNSYAVENSLEESKSKEEKDQILIEELKQNVQKLQEENAILVKKSVQNQQSKKMLDIELKKLRSEYEQLQKIYNKRTHQLETAKAQLRFSIQSHMRSSSSGTSFATKRQNSSKQQSKTMQDMSEKQSNAQQTQTEPFTELKIVQQISEFRHTKSKMGRTMIRSGSNVSHDKRTEITKKNQEIRKHFEKLLYDIYTIFEQQKNDSQIDKTLMEEMIKSGRFDAVIELVRDRMEEIKREEEAYKMKQLDQQGKKKKKSASSKPKKKSYSTTASQTNHTGSIKNKALTQIKNIFNGNGNANGNTLDPVMSYSRFKKQNKPPVNQFEADLEAQQRKTDQSIASPKNSNKFLSGTHLRSLKETSEEQQEIDLRKSMSKKEKPITDRIPTNLAFEELNFGDAALDDFVKRQAVKNKKLTSQRIKLKTMNPVTPNSLQNGEKQVVEKRRSHLRPNRSILIKLENYDFSIQSNKIMQFIKCSKQTDFTKYQRLVMDLLHEMSRKMETKNMKEVTEKICQKYNPQIYAQIKFEGLINNSQTGAKRWS